MYVSTKLLLILNFETGDSSARYYDIATIVETESKGSIYSICADITDSLSSYLDSVDTEDLSYEDIVSDVLNNSDYEWSFPQNGIPAVGAYRILYI